MNKNIYNIVIWICLAIAVLSVYGKYFVETTEIGKLSAGLMTFQFIVLAFLVNITKLLEKDKK